MATAPRTTLTFLGAASTVTGSKYLLMVGDRRVLIDSGLFQGEKKWRLKNWEDFPIDPASISDIVLTHAHMDHVGYLPALTSRGFDGPIWCTEGTRQLAEIVLRDAAKLQEQDAADANARGYSKHDPALPLYTTEDVEAMLDQFVALEYETDFELTGNERPGFTASEQEAITIRLTRAGHILGSASVNVWTPTASVLFSGDLGRRDHPVLKSRQVPREGAPFVLIESTYGDREHPEPANLPHEGFADVIRRTIERGGSVLVPAFAIDRTEVVLKTISDLERQGRIPDVPVYVNSPMGVRALRVYQTLTDEIRDDLHPEDFVKIPDLTAVESPEDSRKLTGEGGHGPAIIISSSGMATGGRVLHHLEAMLPDARNAVVLTGYQAVGTRGRQLSEGADQLKMYGRYIPVKAEVYHDHEFSVHADCSDLLDWLGALGPAPQQVFCVHGEADAAAAFAARIKADLGISAVVPTHGEVVLLDTDELTPHPGTKVAAPRRSALDGAPPRESSAGSPVEESRYRLVTGEPSPAFEQEVSEVLEEGYTLAGSPTLAVVGDKLIAGQALVRPRSGESEPTVGQGR
ncbi:MAG: MBL fold metallo-hydrolase RNA specificity domain-containing protein [Propionibacteriaceae bacterium]|nr:MBL fold metallo-hydrolase RNA specificity domain-containing protein [Propionibacteriaceae bacterium]